MSKKFKSLLNLTTLSSDPNGSEGDVFFNTVEKALKIHNGTTWITLAKNDDPTPFYLHTHTYDGNVHTIDVSNPISFKNLSGGGTINDLPVIIGIDGGTPSSQVDSSQTLNLTLTDGGNIGN